MSRALPEIIIDRKTGAVCVASTEAPIAEGMSRDAAMTVLSAFYQTNINHQNGYEWLNFDGMAIKEMPAGMSLCFFEGRLQSVSFGVSLPDMQLEQDWPTRESSQRMVLFMKEFLREQLGKKCVRSGIEMPWGEAWSSFDEKGFCASSGLRYNLPKNKMDNSP